jgi:hypothetical protein
MIGRTNASSMSPANIAAMNDKSVCATTLKNVLSLSVTAESPAQYLPVYVVCSRALGILRTVEICQQLSNEANPNRMKNHRIAPKITDRSGREELECLREESKLNTFPNWAWLRYCEDRIFQPPLGGEGPGLYILKRFHSNALR